MSYSKLILRDSAEIVWPLDDINNSSSVSKSINFLNNNPYSYSASINTSRTDVLSTPLIFGGGTLLNLTSSAVCFSVPALDRFSELFNNKESVISLWFQTDELFSVEHPIIKKRGTNNIGLFIKDNYLIFRYGTTASYVEVTADIANPNEPNHIVIGKTRFSINLILNGIAYNNFDNLVNLDKDNNHILNNYLDFYGPIQKSWKIDCVALYPNLFSTTTAKRHYVYGLGKTVSDDIFYSRGGNIYNMSTLSTERLSDINWDHKDEWNFKSLTDLVIEKDGIKTISYSEPSFYSFDNNVNKSSNSISFNLSGSVTKASYIQIDDLYTKLGGGNNPFFVKIKLDGSLPDQYTSQRIMSYGRLPDNEILKFNLYNDGGIYKINALVPNSSSVSFTISNISSSPSIYVGMQFSGYTKIFFAESGASIQSASFSYNNSAGYGIDPLMTYFPPTPDTVLRFGSSINYDQSSFIDYVYDVEQFYGSIERFLVTQDNFSSSLDYSYLNSYNKSRYEYVYDSSKNKFKIKTYGEGNFILHSINFSEYIEDSDQRIGSNIVKFGYPDVSSASQVFIYVTHLDYSQNILQPKTKLNQNNYLGFLNNKNISDTYLLFDFEIYSEDSINYPPKIKYFQMQTFKSNNSNTRMRDDAGPDYILYPSISSGSAVYLPEIRYTPTIFLTNNSGIKLNRTITDFTENILSKPLDPTTIDGLQLWLDSRFINGLEKVNNSDDTRVNIWKDISGNNNNAIQNVSASAPIFRAQSLNLLRSNQLSGTDTGDTSFIISNNSTIESSTNGLINGEKSIEIKPNDLSIDSYFNVGVNTASITVFPGESYSIVGSIRLNKPQTASALHFNARKIVVNLINNGVEVFTASSIASENIAGVYSLSTTFTTSSVTTGAILKFYNGSYSSKDIVYWDNLGLYPIISGSIQSTWVEPLTVTDFSTVKFDGNKLFLQSSASISGDTSIYLVGRNFGDSIFLNSSTASILYSNSSSYFISFNSNKKYAISNNNFKIFSILNDGSKTSLFINGIYQDSETTGSLDINEFFVGKGLKGDISELLVFNKLNSTKDRYKIENWLSEIFNIPVVQEAEPLSYYSSSYTNQY